MSHTNSTTNYNLPQFITTDKPFWLTDVNQAYSAIDTAMKNNADAAATADTKATDAGTAASTADSKATAAKSAADGAVGSLADAFSDISTYAVDDVVIYNSLLYICTTAVTTPGAWTGSTNWTRTTVDALKQSKSASNLGTSDKTIVGAINELNTNKANLSLLTTYTKVSKSYASGIAQTGSGLSLTTYNKIAFVSGYLHLNGSTAADTTLADLGTALAEQAYGLGFISGGSPVELQIDGTGHLVLKRSVTGTPWINFSFMIILA